MINKGQERQTKTADTLMERGYFMRVGLLPIYVKPLTLGQVIEIGELSSYLEEYDMDEEPSNMAKFAFRHSMDVETLQEIALVAVFRSKFKRKIFGWYIRKRLNTRILKDCLKAVFNTFDYAFFFSSTIFLKEMKRKKKAKKNEGKDTEIRPGVWQEG